MARFDAMTMRDGGGPERDRAGAFLAGRRTWEPGPATEADDPTSKPNGGRFIGPMVVLTHRPDEAPDDPAVTFVSGGEQVPPGSGH